MKLIGDGLKEMEGVLLYIARSGLPEHAALGHCGSDAVSKLKKGPGKLSSALLSETKRTYPLTAPIKQLWILRECAAESTAKLRCSSYMASPVDSAGDKAFDLDGPSSSTQQRCFSVLMSLIFSKVWAGQYLWY